MATIALDTMGGDEGVATAVLAAAELSLAQDAGIILVGDQAQIDPVLRRARYDAGYLAVQHASQYVEMGESPKEALKAKPDASINIGARLVAEGSADALVSAGNTGACILSCVQHFETIAGVPRTALAAVFPTEQRRGTKDDPFSLILDVGATLAVDRTHSLRSPTWGVPTPRASRVIRTPQWHFCPTEPNPTKVPGDRRGPPTPPGDSASISLEISKGSTCHAVGLMWL